MPDIGFSTSFHRLLHRLAQRYPATMMVKEERSLLFCQSLLHVCVIMPGGLTVRVGLKLKREALIAAREAAASLSVTVPVHSDDSSDESDLSSSDDDDDDSDKPKKKKAPAPKPSKPDDDDMSTASESEDDD